MPSGSHPLEPMLEQVEQNMGAKPQAVSADTGFWNPEQVQKIQAQGIDLHVATSKRKHGETGQPAADLFGEEDRHEKDGQSRSDLGKTQGLQKR